MSVIVTGWSAGMTLTITGISGHSVAVMEQVLRVVLPEDPDAYWDLEIAGSDYLWHDYRDLMWECADYASKQPGITDVPYEGGEVIPVCGTIALTDLEALVREWWTAALQSPFLREFVRRLRMDEPDAQIRITPSREATVTWHEAGDGSLITVVTKELDLAHAVTEMGAQCRDELWPDNTVEEAGFNLLLVHLQEATATGDMSRPLRIDSRGLVWPDRRRER
jgi:hypothetical protein